MFKACLLLALAAGLVVGGYVYLRLDDEIRRQVEQRLAEHYHTLQVRVGAARFEKDRGIAVYNVAIHVPVGDQAPQPILTVDEMYLAGKLRVEELLSDHLRVDEIVLRRANLHAMRGGDGQWNVKVLLPLPELSEESPIITIEDATVVLDDESDASSPAKTIQGLDLKLTPMIAEGANSRPRRFRVAGTATSLPARQTCVEGEICTTNGTFELNIAIDGLELSTELLAALPHSAAVQLHGAEVSGRADLALQIHRASSDQSPTWAAAVKIDRGRVAHPMLPAPLTELVCTCRADAAQLLVERLDATCGPGSVMLAMNRAGWGRNAQLAMAARLVGLPLNDHIRGLLPERAARVWQRFEPEGTIDADVRLRFDGRQWRPQISAVCRGVSLTDAAKFPYRLKQTTGLVAYRPADTGRPDQLRLNLTGLGGGRPVRIEAELSHLAPTETDGTVTDAGPAVATAARPMHPVGWVKISGDNIPLHEQLLAALPEESEALVRSLQPQGAIDFQFRAEWKDLAQPKAEVTHEIRLKSCAIRPAAFPFPLQEVSGLITAQGDRWMIHDVEGRGGSGSAIVKCRGDLHHDITIEAESVALDDNLKMALPPDAQRVWDELRPQGRVDVTAHLIRHGDQPEPVITARLEPREGSVSIEPIKFPYRLEQIRGVAVYDAGQIDLQNISARHERAEYSAAAGTVEATAEGGWRLNLSGVNADRLSPRDLIVALPPGIQRTIERLQPGGTFSVYNSSLSIAKSPQAERPAAAWDMKLVCQQASLRSGGPLQSMTGEIHLVGRDDRQALFTAGELSLDSLVWKDVQLTNVRGPVWIDPTECLLGEAASHKQGQSPRRITADAYGGSVSANIELQPNPSPSYKIDMAVGGASLARFANERLGGPEDMTGTVSGRLAVAGAADSAQTLRGVGELHVVDANIYELPVLVAMLKVLRNRTPDTTAFNRCDMHFTIDGENIEFQQLNLLGDAVSLYGKGGSGFDRRLDLMFYTLIEPANLPIPLWKTIAGEFSKQAWQLKVVGTWDKVEVQPQALPAVNQMFEQIQAGAATIAPSTATRDTGTVPR